MAGATNRAFKAAGIPKAAIKELRVTGGRGLTLRSAIGLASERGIAIGDKAKAHLAARDRKAAASPEGQAAAVDFRAKAAAGLKSMAERKAALQAARQQRVGKSIGAAMQVARSMRQKQAADAQAKAAADAPVRIKPQPASPSDARAAHARRNAVRKSEHHSLRTSMRGYGRMSEGQLQPIRTDLSAGRAAVSAAGAPPKGQVWRYGAGTVSAVKPSKQGNGFFAYQEGRGGRTYIVHAASGVSVGDYRDKMIAHAALDGMKKGGNRLSAGLSRGEEKAVKLAFRYQQKTRTSDYAVQTQRKVFAKQRVSREARGLPSL